MIKRLVNPSKLQSFFLFGPRGSGKSTLLKALFKDQEVLWIDLLNQQTDFDLNQRPDSLLETWQSKRQKWVVIDEVQKIPKLMDVVHHGIEEHRIKFALTGSSSRKLKRGGANLLGGRAATFSLAPFSSFELGDRFDLKQALRLGLFPRFWEEGNTLEEADKIRSVYSYIQTYLKEEVAAEQLVRNLDPFRRFLVAAAQSNGKIINYSKIENDAGVSHSQAERHFEILCDTLVGRYLEPFHTSIRKRQTKKSKFYFFDTSIVRGLTNLLSEPLNPSTYEYGSIFETFLVNEFFKISEALEKHWQFSYLRTKDDVEVDLIIEKPRGAPILIEIKSSDHIKPEDVTSFSKISCEIKNQGAFIFSNTKNSWTANGVTSLHWKDGLKLLFA